MLTVLGLHTHTHTNTHTHTDVTPFIEMLLATTHGDAAIQPLPPPYPPSPPHRAHPTPCNAPREMTCHMHFSAGGDLHCSGPLFGNFHPKKEVQMKCACAFEIETPPSQRRSSLLHIIESSAPRCVHSVLFLLCLIRIVIIIEEPPCMCRSYQHIYEALSPKSVLLLGAIFTTLWYTLSAALFRSIFSLTSWIGDVMVLRRGVTPINLFFFICINV